MIQIGMLVSERYEILEKVGTGGMSDIYKAKCHKLNRLVAMKVLKQEFSENTDFVSKFHIEAQATAGLAHPNIVNVYDVGEEDGMHYIVMELVEGITLKRYIEKKSSLTVKEAISIAIQVSMGIEVAHNNHIIHRDIKPQNIMISKDGKVKVADFGIAKAATSNTITSNVMGSVHYTSPEQARGGFSDEKSDIYSLGITMFEMITGRVPFNGDTTVAIAIKHIQEPIPMPSTYAEEIPVSLEQIIMKCTQKSPDRRYSNIADVIADLKKSLMYPDDDFVEQVTAESQDQTRMITGEEQLEIRKRTEQEELAGAPRRAQQDRKPTGVRVSSESEAKRPKAVVSNSESAKGNKKKSDKTKSTKPKTTKKKTSNPKATKAKTKTEQIKSNKKRVRPVDMEEEVYDSKKEKILTVATIVVGVTIALLILFITAKSVGVFDNIDSMAVESQELAMIDVMGLSISDAQDMLDDAGILYEITYQKSSDYDKNLVVGVSVLPDEVIQSDDVVTITVGSGMDGVVLDDVTGLLEAEATAALENEGFVVVKERDYDDNVTKGNVISQFPSAGDTIERGTEVTIVISEGMEENKVRVPDVLGMTQENAILALEAEGLTYEISMETENSIYAVGTVSYQSYSVGSYVESGSVIRLRISTGGGTYSCSTTVNAPFDYVSGEAVVTLVTDAGVELFNTTVTSFPVPINISSITGSSSGMIQIA
ncbi:MAG: Stk1 family PASTA domain-containing Ser/Thr kinase, partial [Eubacteriales bacterium]